MVGQSASEGGSMTIIVNITDNSISVEDNDATVEVRDYRTEQLGTPGDCVLDPFGEPYVEHVFKGSES